MDSSKLKQFLLLKELETHKTSVNLDKLHSFDSEKHPKIIFEYGSKTFGTEQPQETKSDNDSTHSQTEKWLNVNPEQSQKCEWSKNVIDQSTMSKWCRRDSSASSSDSGFPLSPSPPYSANSRSSISQAPTFLSQHNVPMSTGFSDGEITCITPPPLPASLPPNLLNRPLTPGHVPSCEEMENIASNEVQTIPSNDSWHDGDESFMTSDSNSDSSDTDSGSSADSDSCRHYIVTEDIPDTQKENMLPFQISKLEGSVKSVHKKIRPGTVQDITKLFTNKAKRLKREHKKRVLKPFLKPDVTPTELLNNIVPSKEIKIDVMQPKLLNDNNTSDELKLDVTQMVLHDSVTNSEIKQDVTRTEQINDSVTINEIEQGVTHTEQLNDSVTINKIKQDVSRTEQLNDSVTVHEIKQDITQTEQLNDSAICDEIKRDATETELLNNITGEEKLQNQAKIDVTIKNTDFYLKTENKDMKFDQGDGRVVHMSSHICPNTNKEPEIPEDSNLTYHSQKQIPNRECNIGEQLEEHLSSTRFKNRAVPKESDLPYFSFSARMSNTSSVRQSVMDSQNGNTEETRTFDKLRDTISKNADKMPEADNHPCEDVQIIECDTVKKQICDNQCGNSGPNNRHGDSLCVKKENTIAHANLTYDTTCIHSQTNSHVDVDSLTYSHVDTDSLNATELSKNSDTDVKTMKHVTYQILKSDDSGISNLVYVNDKVHIARNNEDTQSEVSKKSESFSLIVPPVVQVKTETKIRTEKNSLLETNHDDISSSLEFINNPDGTVVQRTEYNKPSDSQENPAEQRLFSSGQTLVFATDSPTQISREIQLPERNDNLISSQRSDIDFCTHASQKTQQRTSVPDISSCSQIWREIQPTECIENALISDDSSCNETVRFSDGSNETYLTSLTGFQKTDEISDMERSSVIGVDESILELKNIVERNNEIIRVSLENNNKILSSLEKEESRQVPLESDVSEKLTELVNERESNTVLYALPGMPSCYVTEGNATPSPETTVVFKSVIKISENDSFDRNSHDRVSRANSSVESDSVQVPASVNDVCIDADDNQSMIATDGQLTDRSDLTDDLSNDNNKNYLRKASLNSDSSYSDKVNQDFDGEVTNENINNKYSNLQVKNQNLHTLTVDYPESSKDKPENYKSDVRFVIKECVHKPTNVNHDQNSNKSVKNDRVKVIRDVSQNAESTISERKTSSFVTSNSLEEATDQACLTSGGPSVTSRLTASVSPSPTPEQVSESHTNSASAHRNTGIPEFYTLPGTFETDKIVSLKELSGIARGRVMSEKSCGYTSSGSESSGYTGGRKVRTKTTTLRSKAGDSTEQNVDLESNIHLKHLAETISKLNGQNSEELLPEINQTVTKLPGGNLVITTLTHKIVEEEDDEKEVRRQPEQEDDKRYIVQDHKGNYYMVEDITDDSQESAYYSSSSDTHYSNDQQFHGIQNLQAIGKSGINYDTAEEILLGLYNPGGYMQIQEYDEHTQEGKYLRERYHQGQQPYQGSMSSDSMYNKHTTTYAYDEPDQRPQNFGSSSVKTVKHSYEVDGGNEDEYTKKEAMQVAESHADTMGMSAMNSSYLMETSAMMVPPVPAFIPQPPLILPPPVIPQYRATLLDVTPSVHPPVQVCEEKKDEEVIKEEIRVNTDVERPIYKSVALVKGPYETPKWQTTKREFEPQPLDKCVVLSSRASDEKQEETVEETTTKSYYHMQQSSGCDVGQDFTDQSSYVTQFPNQRYKTEKVFQINGSAPSQTANKTFETKLNISGDFGKRLSSNQMQHHSRVHHEPQVYQDHSRVHHEPQVHQDHSSKDMRVVRGNILIKNTLDQDLDEFNDNINLFDQAFNMNKDNPMYHSDEDLYRQYELEKERERSRFQEVQDKINNDITYEAVDRFSKSKEVKRQQEQQRPKQNLSQLLLSRLGTIDSKDIRQHIDVKHHHEDIYGDLRFIHADGTNARQGGTSNFDSVEENVDLMLKNGKGYITVTVTAERITPIDIEFNVWRKNQAIVTRVIEIDFFANDQRRRLYETVMERANTRQTANGGYTYVNPRETVLSSQETLNLFTEIMDAAEGEGDKEDITVRSSQKKTRIPGNNLDFLY